MSRYFEKKGLVLKWFLCVQNFFTRLWILSEISYEYKDIVISESMALNYPVRELYRVNRGFMKNTYEKLPI